MKFNKFISFAELGSAYYNNYKSSAVPPRGLDNKFITPTKEDFYRAQCFLSQEVTALQKDCEQLRGLVNFWSNSVTSVEEELSENNPALFGMLSEARSDNERIVIQSKVKKLWEASLLEAKTKIEDWKLEMETRRFERLKNIEVTLQKDVSKSNKIVTELKEMQEAIQIDREQMIQKHQRFFFLCTRVTYHF